MGADWIPSVSGKKASHLRPTSCRVTTLDWQSIIT